MNHEITKQGWLVAGCHRVKLATIERYEQREGKVIIRAAQWDVTIDCDPDPQFMSKAIAKAKTKEDREAAVEVKAEHYATARTTAADIMASLDEFFAKPEDGKVIVTLGGPPST